MNNFNWINYNNNFQLLKKLRKYNKNNKFNFIEKENYNHIRDLYCLALLIAQIKAKKLSVKVLDYGSNNLVYANLANKINLKKFKIHIFDPFCSVNKLNSKIKNLSIFNNTKRLLKNWDLINFGSSIQYLDKISTLDDINFKKAKVILITHTPISLSKSYKCKQNNNKDLFQIIHSFSEINKFMKKKGFKLHFKSRNDNKYIASKTKFKTYSLNLLFLK